MIDKDRFRLLGDVCLENFTENFFIDRTGVEQSAISSPDGNPSYVPKLIVNSLRLKSIFDLNPSIKDLDYIFDDINIPIEEDRLKNQLYYSDILFLPIYTSNLELVKRMLKIIDVIKGLRTNIVIIAIQPLSSEIELHHASDKIIKILDTLGFCYILIPSKKINKNLCNDVQLYIDKLVVQTVLSTVELVVLTGVPSATSCSVNPILSIKGQGMVGVGSAYGKDRAVNAIINVLNCPSFDLSTLNKAKGLIVNITTGNNYSIDEYEQIVSILHKSTSENITTGFSNYVAFQIIKENIKDDRMFITLIATGI